MSFSYSPISLFNEENFAQCIVIPFPEGGKIVDTLVLDKTAFILVESHPNARVISAHFHIVPMLQRLYSDSYEYVGTYKMENFNDQALAFFTVIQIPNGDYGIHSQEYIELYGDELSRKVMGESDIHNRQPDTQDIPQPLDDDQLRKLWDIGIGFDKTDDDDDLAAETES